MHPPFSDTDIVDDDDEPLPGEGPGAPPDDAVPGSPADWAGVGCVCPACAVKAALLLLDSGRPAMAATVLRAVPGAIVDEQQAAREAGVAEGLRLAEVALSRPPQRQPQRPVGPRRPAARGVPAKALAASPATASLPRQKPWQVLDGLLVSGRVTVDRVAALLGVRPPDVSALREGRATLAPGAWARLFEAVANDVAAKKGQS